MSQTTTGPAHALPSSGLAGTAAASAAGGLAGGMIFGMLMQMMGMMGMVAGLIGSSSTAVGWLVHLVISATLGLAYAPIAQRLGQARVPGLVVGMMYGVFWWVVGALWLMPAKLGMSDMFFHVGATQWKSLMGHLIFGVVLGGVASWAGPRLAARHGH